VVTKEDKDKVLQSVLAPLWQYSAGKSFLDRPALHIFQVTEPTVDINFPDAAEMSEGSLGMAVVFRRDAIGSVMMGLNACRTSPLQFESNYLF
jgi:hypothetical protein